MSEFPSIQVNEVKEGGHLLLSISTIGARHLLQSQVCQDSSLCSFEDGIYFIGVADGHGDKKHHLSHIGSQLALEVAKQILTEALQSIDSSLPPRDWTSYHQNIEKRIRWEWNIACKKSLGETNPTGDWTEALLPFGTTLLAACGDHRGNLYFQLGDGDIAHLSKGNVVEFVFAEDEDMMGTVTYSLCQPYRESISDCKWVPKCHKSELIFLCTDGIRDSLQGERTHLESAIHWIQRKVHDSLSDSKQPIADWLHKISQQGNGDDISIGVGLINLDVDHHP